MHLRNRDASEAEEQRRFAAMNDMLNPTSVGMLRLRGGERILDVGCGLGQLTRAMARAVGRDGRVIGVVHCASWLEEAERQAALGPEATTVEFRTGDLHEPPLTAEEWGSFDLVHGRFILEQVPSPARVVEAMVRAVRPGGRVVLEDDDHDMILIWPEPAGFRSLWEGYVRWAHGQAYDPFVGRRLVSLLHGAGAVPTRSSSLSVSACAGSPSFRPLLTIVKSVFESVRGPMMASGAIGGPEFDAGMRGFNTWADQPESALWYTTCWAEGRRPV